jgi:Icc-related predicted phosphoesterase
MDYHSGKKRFPVPIYFVKGNHEDFDVIEDIRKGMVENLHYMENGKVYDIAGLRVGAVGGNYSEKYYHMNRRKIHGSRRRHLNHSDFSDLYLAGDLDLIVGHECPDGVGFINRHDGKDMGSTAIRELIETKQPAYYFHGHHHRYNEARIGETEVVGLGIIYGTDKSIMIMEH